MGRKLDIVVTDIRSNNVSVMLNVVLARLATRSSFLPASPYAIAIADVTTTAQ